MVPTLIRRAIAPMGWLLLVACAPTPPPTQTTSFTVPRTRHRAFLDLPWPSDLDRRADGTLDLRAFPNPTNSSTLDDYVGITEPLTGYATNGIVYLGTGALLDAATLPAAVEAARDNLDASVQFIDVTTGAQSYGQRFPVRIKAYGAGDIFVPEGALAVAPELGFVLRPASQYAVVVTTVVRTAGGRALRASDDLAQCLTNEIPADAVLVPCHTMFAPLRALWAHESRDVGDIANATLFTTQDPTVVMRATAEDVRARNGTSVDSLGEARDFATHAEFWVYEGTLTLDQFQKGEPPFSTFGSGGFVVNAAGVAQAQRRETMPFALTVPKAAAPVTGAWPLVLIAHGTGGNYRSFIGDRDGDESTFLTRAGYAALAISQPLHEGREGYRAGFEDLATFNVFNPIVGRSNWQQSALETVMLARYFRDGTLPASTSGTGIHLDTRWLGFFGHSQGGLTGAIALGVDRDIRHAVLSGAGGGFAASLIAKQSPTKPADAIRTLMSLPSDYDIDLFHPILALLQTFAEASDPLDYATLVRDSAANRTPPSLLMTSGYEDTYTPVINHAPLGVALGLPLVEQVIEVPPAYALAGWNIEPMPVQNNANGVTRGFAQFRAPAGRDGHFVVFDNPRATSTVRTFFATAHEATPVIDTRWESQR